MRIFCRRLTCPKKVAVSCFLVLLFILYYNNYRAFQLPSHLTVVGLRNLRGPALISPSGPSCPPGFYTKEDLKPHFQRPPQDPKAPGAHGKAFRAHLLSHEELYEKSRGFRKNQFNQFASDRISLHRDLGKDTRHPDCLKQRFLCYPGLPTTSVIIVFHNEAWSTLLRTVYSVLHTAPAALLTEILLVDDASTDDHLKTRLDEYVKELKIVRVLRQKERKGLVTARLLGSHAAQGEVLTFLDSHCECFPGWLEPLLARIAEQPTAVVSPDIVSIDQDTLRFQKPHPTRHIRGNFDWKLTFGWEVIPNEQMKQRKNETYPIRTPTFAGGLFSVSKSYFEHIGTYDDQMEFWGGENLEMSFRVWQCGGQLEIIPCSVVGHIFRRWSPHTFPNSTSTIVRNLVRLAEVWMDDYRWVFYRVDREAASIFEEKSFGDVTARRKLRERLKCKNFDWYIKNIYPEVYIPDIRPHMHGQLENIGWNCHLAVDGTVKKRFFQRLQCIDEDEDEDEDETENFEYTSKQEVRLSSHIEMCLHAHPGGILVSLEQCHLKGNFTTAAPQQVWIYTQKKQLMSFFSGKCLTTAAGYVTLTECALSRLSQRWLFT